MSKAWAKGSTRKWRLMRVFILERDNYRCQLKVSPRCQGVATAVHHTLGRGISELPEHLVACCTPCNNKVGQPLRPTTNPAPRTNTDW